MASIEKSIEVEVPVSTAYNQWTLFEDFPSFMEGVEEVRQLEDDRVHWVADIGGRHKEWDARIVEQVPDQRIAWVSEDGAPNGGIVRFEPLGNDGALVHLEMQYEPEGFAEGVGDALGFMDRRVQGDLERFKHYVESRGMEAGGWRGRIGA